MPYADFGDPQSLNLYGYVRSTPTSKLDADGHVDWGDFWERIKRAFKEGHCGGLVCPTDREAAAQKQEAAATARQQLLKDGAKPQEVGDLTDQQALDAVAAAENGQTSFTSDGETFTFGGPEMPNETHHELPQQYKEQFKKAGIDIEKYTKELPKDAHRLKPDGLHARGPNGWNQTWGKFFAENPNATKEQILQQLDRMRNEFGVK